MKSTRCFILLFALATLVACSREKLNPIPDIFDRTDYSFMQGDTVVTVLGSPVIPEAIRSAKAYKDQGVVVLTTRTNTRKIALSPSFKWPVGIEADGLVEVNGIVWTYETASGTACSVTCHGAFWACCGEEGGVAVCDCIATPFPPEKECKAGGVGARDCSYSVTEN